MNEGSSNVPIVPEVGKAGEFRMTMYRGVRRNRRGGDFASDPGDYGRGEYWTDCRTHAETFYAEGDGDVLSREIYLKNALHLTPAEIAHLAREVYGTTVIENSKEARLEGARRLTEDMRARGYDGIVVKGYDGPAYSVCIFEKREDEDIAQSTAANPQET